MPTDGVGHQEFCPHPIRGGEKNRILVSTCRKVEPTGESTETINRARPRRRARGRLDRLDQFRSGGDIDTGILIRGPLNAPLALARLLRYIGARPKGTKIMEPGRFAMAPLRKLAAISVLGIAVLPSTVGKLPATEAYTIANVGVDNTAADAALARRNALASGQREALARLIKRLVPIADQSRFPKLADENITALVRSFEIEEEKVAPNRYIGLVRYRFKSRAVGELLRGNGISYAKSPGEALLVLPVYTAGGTTVLWGERNSWHAAWAELPPSDGLREVLVPIGDLTDILTYDVAYPPAKKPSPGADGIAQRYGAGETMTVSAELTTGPDESVSAVEVEIGPLNSREGQVTTYRNVAGGTIESLLAAAAEATRNQLEESWKSSNLLRFDHEETLDVDITFTGHAGWLDIRRRLDGMTIVRDIAIAQISPRFARVTLHYLGDRTRLEDALGKSALRLDHESGVWRLSHAEVASPQPAHLPFEPAFPPPP